MIKINVEFYHYKNTISMTNELYCIPLIKFTSIAKLVSGRFQYRRSMVWLQPLVLSLNCVEKTKINKLSCMTSLLKFPSYLFVNSFTYIFARHKEMKKGSRENLPCVSEHGTLNHKNDHLIRAIRSEEQIGGLLCSNEVANTLITDRTWVWFCSQTMDQALLWLVTRWS